MPCRYTFQEKLPAHAQCEFPGDRSLRHPTRVLIQHGRQDEQVLIAEGRAMYAAVAGDDDVVWAEYDGRHTIDDRTVYDDRLTFFGLQNPG